MNGSNVNNSMGAVPRYYGETSHAPQHPRPENSTGPGASQHQPQQYESHSPRLPSHPQPQPLVLNHPQEQTSLSDFQAMAQHSQQLQLQQVPNGSGMCRASMTIIAVEGNAVPTSLPLNPQSPIQQTTMLSNCLPVFRPSIASVVIVNHIESEQPSAPSEHEVMGYVNQHGAPQTQ